MTQKQRHFPVSPSSSTNWTLRQRLSHLLPLWTLRLQVPLGGHRAFIDKVGFEDEGLASLLGLGVWIQQAETEGSIGRVAVIA